jgi:hypothetical protein
MGNILIYTSRFLSSPDLLDQANVISDVISNTDLDPPLEFHIILLLNLPPNSTVNSNPSRYSTTTNLLATRVETIQEEETSEVQHSQDRNTIQRTQRPVSPVPLPETNRDWNSQQDVQTTSTLRLKECSWHNNNVGLGFHVHGRIIGNFHAQNPMQQPRGTIIGAVTPYIVFQEHSCKKMEDNVDIVSHSMSGAYELMPASDIVAGAELPRVEVDMTRCSLNGLYKPGKIKTGGVNKTVCYVFLITRYVLGEMSWPEVVYYESFVLGTKNSTHSVFLENWGTHELAHPRVTLSGCVALLLGNSNPNGMMNVIGRFIQTPVQTPRVQTVVPPVENQSYPPVGSISRSRAPTSVHDPTSLGHMEPFPRGNLVPFGEHHQPNDKRVIDRVESPKTPPNKRKKVEKKTGSSKSVDKVKKVVKIYKEEEEVTTTNFRSEKEGKKDFFESDLDQVY